jgi:hypothetical protein
MNTCLCKLFYIVNILAIEYSVCSTFVCTSIQEINFSSGNDFEIGPVTTGTYST